MPRALWPDIFGKPYHGGPKSDIIFQILYRMGIYPEVTVFSNYFCEIFDTMDAAVDYYARRFRILSEKHQPILKAYLETHCQKDGRGLVHGFNHNIMKLSWRPGTVNTEGPKETQMTPALKNG